MKAIGYKRLQTMRPKRIEALTRKLQGELIIYDLRTNCAYCLNESAARVWQACDGRTTIADIVEQLATVYGTSESTIYVALAEFEEAKLLEKCGGSLRELSSNARRELIKRVGKAAAVLALPVVTSLLVPEPASAASCFPLLHSCSNNSQCCSGHCGVSGVSLVCVP